MIREMETQGSAGVKLRADWKAFGSRIPPLIAVRTESDTDLGTMLRTYCRAPPTTGDLSTY